MSTSVYCHGTGLPQQVGKMYHPFKEFTSTWPLEIKEQHTIHLHPTFLALDSQCRGHRVVLLNLSVHGA